MSAQAILSEIKDLESSPSHVRTCEQIIYYMSEKRFEELQMLTYSSFAKACDKKEIDQELLGAIALLVSMPFPALEVRAMLVDDENNEFEISLQEINDAERTGGLIHPESGYPIVDFRKKIFHFFVASSFFFAE